MLMIGKGERKERSGFMLDLCWMASMADGLTHYPHLVRVPDLVALALALLLSHLSPSLSVDPLTLG